MTDPTAPTGRYVPRLSKSRYISGRQCHLRLYNECFAPEAATEPDAALQHVFDTGHRVGELATQRYPGGVLIDEDHLHFEEAWARTQLLLNQGVEVEPVPAIFESALRYRDVKCRVDILVRAADGTWDLIEVKSTGRAKDVHVWDLALQVWVARGAGLKVRQAGVMTLNTKYVHPGGPYRLGGLFRLHDLTEEVSARANQIEQGVGDMQRMLQSPEPPQISPGPHCHTPYDCSFYTRCTQGMSFPEHPLSQLPGFSAKKRQALEQAGIVDVRDLADGAQLTQLQERVRVATLTQQVFVGPGLGAALAEPIFPIHHLDFETFMPTLPLYKGTRPFQALPFQWSNHIEHEDGSIEHQEFLAEGDDDPRLACARSLVESLGTAGTIVTYSPYEKRVIGELARAVPAHRKQLLALLKRCWDLHPVIKAHFYHPEFRGSYSLKVVLPALVPTMSYEGLAIGDGLAAQLGYLRLLDTVDPAEKENLRQALLQYCRQDTLAMVELRRALLSAAAA